MGYRNEDIMLKCYYINLEGGCSYEQSLVLYKKLSAERRAKVDKLKNAEVRAKQIISGAFLEYCLRLETGILEGELPFQYNEHGKPYLKNSNIHFNMSHSGEYAVLAVGDSRVGIDVERLRKNRLSVARRCFCPEEYADIMSAGDKLLQELRFLEYWTMKEAYVKYIGAGLSIPLNSFCIVRRDDAANEESYTVTTDNTPVSMESNTQDNCIIYVSEFAKGYRMALCTETDVGAEALRNPIEVDILRMIG